MSSFGTPCTYPSITQKLIVGARGVEETHGHRLDQGKSYTTAFFSWNLGFLERSSWLWGALKTTCELSVNGRLLFFSLLCLFFLLRNDSVSAVPIPMTCWLVLVWSQLFRFTLPTTDLFSIPFYFPLSFHHAREFPLFCYSSHCSFSTQFGCYWARIFSLLLTHIEKSHVDEDRFLN